MFFGLFLYDLNNIFYYCPLLSLRLYGGYFSIFLPGFLFTFTPLPFSSTHRFAEFAIIVKRFRSISNDSFYQTIAKVVIHYLKTLVLSLF